MPRVDDVALARKRQVVLARLRSLTASQLATLWARLGSYEDGDQVRWVRSAGPVLTAGQNRAIDMTIAYLSSRLGDRISFDRAEILGRSGIDLTEPFTALGRALNSGRGLDDALEAGRLRAEAVGESGVQWASRAANTAVEGDGRIVGWRRVLDGDACAWCVTVAQQRYHSADSASFGHERCGCDVDPIIGTRDPGRTINRSLSS